MPDDTTQETKETTPQEPIETPAQLVYAREDSGAELANGLQLFPGRIYTIGENITQEVATRLFEDGMLIGYEPPVVEEPAEAAPAASSATKPSVATQTSPAATNAQGSQAGGSAPASTAPSQSGPATSAATTTTTAPGNAAENK